MEGLRFLLLNYDVIIYEAIGKWKTILLQNRKCQLRYRFQGYLLSHGVARLRLGSARLATTLAWASAFWMDNLISRGVILNPNFYNNIYSLICHFHVVIYFFIVKPTEICTSTWLFLIYFTMFNTYYVYDDDDFEII